MPDLVSAGGLKSPTLNSLLYGASTAHEIVNSFGMNPNFVNQGAIDSASINSGREKRQGNINCYVIFSFKKDVYKEKMIDVYCKYLVSIWRRLSRWRLKSQTFMFYSTSSPSLPSHPSSHPPCLQFYSTRLTVYPPLPPPHLPPLRLFPLLLLQRTFRSAQRR